MKFFIKHLSTSRLASSATAASLRLAMFLLLCAGGLPEATAVQSNSGALNAPFEKSQRVTVKGYESDIMEPFITPDGNYLLFNNSNEPSINTNLYFASRVDDLTFTFKGEILGVNTTALDAVPSMDRAGNLYFVSTRSYVESFSTIYRGQFKDGIASDVQLVKGVSLKKSGMVNFDVQVSPDGEELYFVDSRFKAGGGPETADLVIAHRHGAVFERVSNSAELLRLINTPALEYAPAVSADGLELFFTRFDPTAGPVPAIFRATRKNKSEPFEAPTKVASAEGFVEAPALSPDGKSLYYHKKDGIRFNLYRVTRH